jgi:beta-fructofuranosidase
MLIGAESHQHEGKQAIYGGSSLDSYQYLGNVDISLENFGFMWEYPTDKNYWAHMLTLPREVMIRGNKLIQQPLEELKALRHSTTPLMASNTLNSRAFELELSVESNFCLELANDNGNKMVFSGNQEEWILDRTDVTEVHAAEFGTVRFAKRLSNQSRVRVFVDNSSIEIFCDDGETVFTSRLFVAQLSQLLLTGVEGSIHYLKGLQYQ